MFKRTLKSNILSSLKKYKCLSLIGPRQSGKTTLAKMCGSDFTYLSLENPDTRMRADLDPRLFLASCKGSVILDEVQYVPHLFSYLQEILDDKSDSRQFILTGSNSFQLNEKISQSLAGRTRIYHVLPLTLAELPQKLIPNQVDELIIKGFYPRIYDEKLEPEEWFSDYYQTYLQKDINMILNISDKNQFDRFVRLCAGRIAQLSDYSLLAHEIGVSQPTAVRWSSVLESSFITFRLPPHFKSFNKQIIKTPKLYFYDTGLLCRLLRIESPESLMLHPLRGQIFENFVIAEMLKLFHSNGMESPLYFWRDKTGHEIDLLLDRGTSMIPMEIKSGATFQNAWLKNLTWFYKISSAPNGHLIYGGHDNFMLPQTNAHTWRSIPELFESIVSKRKRV